MSKYRDKRGIPEPAKSYYDIHGKQVAGRVFQVGVNVYRELQKAPAKGGRIFGVTRKATGIRKTNKG